MAKHKIAVIAGDGIGKEVVPAGIEVLEAAGRSFGVEFQGSVPGLGLCANPTAVQIRSTATGEGYYLLGTDGGVFSFGDAEFKGSLPEINVTPNQPLIDMVVQFPVA